MMIPTVHLNGTSKGHLVAELDTALGALAAAIDAITQITVHGRDYYVQGPAAYAQARHEMDLRLAALGVVQDDLLAMHASVLKQGK
jgi:hypothetical protein